MLSYSVRIAGEVAVTGLLEGAPGLPGVSRTDAAGFILEGVRNTLRGGGRTLSLPHHIVEDSKQPTSCKMATCKPCLALAVQHV